MLWFWLLSSVNQSATVPWQNIKNKIKKMVTRCFHRLGYLAWWIWNICTIDWIFHLDILASWHQQLWNSLFHCKFGQKTHRPTYNSVLDFWKIRGVAISFIFSLKSFSEVRQSRWVNAPPQFSKWKNIQTTTFPPYPSSTLSVSSFQRFYHLGGKDLGYWRVRELGNTQGHWIIPNIDICQ